MKNHNIGFVPVVDDQKRVVGVVTDRDLALRLVAEGRPATDPVSELMTFRDLLTCKPDEDIEVLEARMAREKKARALVVDDEGTCIGVISLSDVAQFEQPERAARLLHDLVHREAIRIARS
jgi:CBS domain-containing protein